MVEQYIYSRSESGFTNSRGQKVPLGFGFVAQSPQMSQTLKNDVFDHCYAYPQAVPLDGRGKLLAIFRKTCLRETGRVLLQCNSRISEASTDENAGKSRRAFHVAHGFILDDKDVSQLQPLLWFHLPYYKENPNQVAGGILLDSLPSLCVENPEISGLANVMEPLGITAELFYKILLACFDAQAFHRQVLIAFDFAGENADDLQWQLLSWLYLCLPYVLRRGMGVDSAYTELSSPQYIQLALVPRQNIRLRNGQVMISIGDQTTSLGGNYLVVDGQMLHSNSYSSKWYGQNRVFTRWLALVVDALWNNKYEIHQLLQELDALYRNIEEQLCSDEQKKSLDPQLYDTLCWAQLCEDAGILTQINAQMELSEQETYACHMTLMSELQDSDMAEAIVEEMINRHVVPAREADIDMLVTALNSAAQKSALYLLGAFMAADADYAGGNQAQVLQQYKKIVPQAPYEWMLDACLFGVQDEEAVTIWENCKADSSEQAAFARRRIWYSTVLPAGKRLDELPQMMEDVLGDCSAFGPEKQSCIAAELADVVKEKFIDPIQYPTMMQITQLADGVADYWQMDRGTLYTAMLASLAGRYVSVPAEAGFARMKTIQKTFEPFLGDPALEECWHQMFQKECKAVAESRSLFVLEENMLQQLRSMEAVVPWQEPQLFDILTNLVYKMLIEDPQPFMTGEWLERNVTKGRFSLIPEAQALRILEQFANGRNQTYDQLNTILKLNNASKTVKGLVRSTLPKMIRFGNLANIPAPFLCFIIRKDPDHTKEYLEYAQKRGGSDFLMDMVGIMERHHRQMPEDTIQDLEFVLETLVGDEALLDEILREDKDQKAEFDAKLIQKVIAMDNKDVLSHEAALMIVNQLYMHYDGNSKSGMTKIKISRAVEKLIKEK